jgi:NAD-dependent SIR2 family protein deacetylase
MPESDCGRLAEAIRAERGLILVLTGAGISLASGIPTFREVLSAVRSSRA